MEQCPKCGLVSPDSAIRCDCGFDFRGHTKSQLNRMYAWNMLGKKKALFSAFLTATVVCAFVGWWQGVFYGVVFIAIHGVATLVWKKRARALDASLGSADSPAPAAATPLNPVEAMQLSVPVEVVAAQVMGDVPLAPPKRAAPSEPEAIRCWMCKAPLPMSPETRGKKVKCPSCGTKQRLPG